MMTVSSTPAIRRAAPVQRAGFMLPAAAQTALALLMVLASVAMTALMVAMAAIVMPAALAVTMVVEWISPQRTPRARPGWRPVPVRAS